MRRLEDADCRFEDANVTVFLVLGAMSFCDRLGHALVPEERGRDAELGPERGIDSEHPAHLVALGLESFGRTVHSLCDGSPTDVEEDRPIRAPANPASFRRMLR